MHTGIPFFLVGAKARDIFFSALFDVPTRRATLDVDIGIKAKSWEDAKRLGDDLIATGGFVRIVGFQFRLRHANGVLIDVIPFGEVENPQGKIQWTDGVVMTTTGFNEAFEYSMQVRFGTDPPLDVRICTPPAMVFLKLIAWNEKYPETTKDAADISIFWKITSMQAMTNDYTERTGISMMKKTLIIVEQAPEYSGGTLPRS